MNKKLVNPAWDNQGRIASGADFHFVNMHLLSQIIAILGQGIQNNRPRTSPEEILSLLSLEWRLDDVQKTVFQVQQQ